MKLEKELKKFTDFCISEKDVIKKYYNDIETSKAFVKSARERVLYDVIIYYAQKIYNKSTYSFLYDMYDCNDTHIYTLGNQGLKAIGL